MTGRGAATPSASRRTVARDTLRRGNRAPDKVLTTTLRTRSVHAREVLAEHAWPGHTPAQLTAWADARPARLEPGMDADMLARYAMVLGLQLPGPEASATVLALADVLEADHALGRVPDRAVEALGQVRLAAGDVRGALRLLERPEVRDDVRLAGLADALNPFAGGPDADERAWAAAFAEAVGGGTAPVRLAPGTGTPFDRLAADAPRVEHPGRVTVLMSTFRPRRSDLLTAVRSVLAQTWSNLELFVVDDASGPGTAALLDEVEALDPRVTVVRKAVNGGTYRARNTALRLMTGDWFTVVDSDDWVHPQMVEVAVRHLLENPGRVAVRSQGVRISEDLRLSRPGYAPRYPSAASLMVPVHPTMARVGFFDPTRKGADTEYARRIEAAFGQRVPTLPHVMTFNRTLAGSLSAEEFSRGWRHGSRHEYKSVYAAWHQGVRAGTEDPWLDPTAPRAFPQPLRWNTRPAAGPRRYDVVFGGDWRRFGGPQRSMLEEIRACLEGGLSVGVLHLEALRFMSTDDPPLCAPLVDLLRSGAVSQLQVDDDVDVDVLVVRYPLILQYPPHAPAAFRPRRVVVVANQAPLELDGSDQRYVVRDVTERTEELFGQRPLWWPQGPTVRELLLTQDPTIELLPTDDLGLIDVDDWHVREDGRDPAAGGELVVGRYSRDDVIKFPSTWADVLAAYDLGPGHRVRMMGARAQLKRLSEAAGSGPDRYPAQWEVLPHRALDTRDFLADLDVFVYLDNPDAHEAFGRVLLEAAASGCVVITHPKHEPTFGAALDYALPHEVPALVERYRDPTVFHARVAQTLTMVRAAFGHERFLADVRTLLGPARPPASVDPDPMLGAPAWLPGVHAGRRVLTLPVRSAADGERADHVALVLADDADAGRVAAWLLATVRDTADSQLDAVLASGAADLGVEAVVVRRDGVVLEPAPEPA
ncbi:glycosyltransferase family 2 protein [Arthrobacter sp. NEB 688]|uniref:glycosyltransferase family 2 protein n=1 Tax=Arthrobacter sp. NEB 688 TaxID=904039 RepID=UPI001566B50F|nr:glycosyltransferase family 2 protein [Arthrobacter sp. NEB 688]QKE85542.1 glycosyltransferase [Arthrobacter sp. NEB 688]